MSAMSQARVVVLTACAAFACGGGAATAPSTAPAPAPAPASPAEPAPRRDADAELEERVRQVVVATRAAMRACYEDGLRRDATLAGRITLVVEIDQSGRASHVLEGRREGGFTDDDVRCFARVLRATRFHDGAGHPMRVQVPLAFQPDAPAP
jgi:hypothetical protein